MQSLHSVSSLARNQLRRIHADRAVRPSSLRGLFRRLVHRIIRRQEAAFGAPMDYMRDLADS